MMTLCVQRHGDSMCISHHGDSLLFKPMMIRCVQYDCHSLCSSSWWPTVCTHFHVFLYLPLLRSDNILSLINSIPELNVYVSVCWFVSDCVAWVCACARIFECETITVSCSLYISVIFVVTPGSCAQVAVRGDGQGGEGGHGGLLLSHQDQNRSARKPGAEVLEWSKK